MRSVAALDRARAAFERQHWRTARAAYEEVLVETQSGEAYQRLAQALYWLGDADGSFGAMESAYAEYRREQRPAQAALAALWLAGQYMRVRANPAAAGGWAARCESLLAEAEAEPGPELAMVILVRGLASGSWEETERAAERAKDMAREFGDADCELLALAYIGLSQVSTGRINEGLARLDEAMAAASSGEVKEPSAVGQIFCALLSGCECTADLKRAELWSRVARPFIEQYAHTGFTGTCRAVYASVLIANGRWNDAERELRLAVESFDTGAPALRGDALSRLAALRVRQGRLDEALGLLEGWHTHPDAQAPLAAIELARGRPRVAAAILERRVRQLGGDVQAGALLLRLVEAHLAAGDADAAERAAAKLRNLSVQGPLSSRGLAALAAGLILKARGADEVTQLEQALALLESSGLVLEAAEARIALAESLAPTNPEYASLEARAAYDRLAAIGARPATDRAAAVLRRLGQPVPASPRGSQRLSSREQDVARLVAVGLSNEQIAARLFLSQRTVEHHVSSILRKLDLTKRTEIAAYAARSLGAGSV